MPRHGRRTRWDKSVFTTPWFSGTRLTHPPTVSAAWTRIINHRATRRLYMACTIRQNVTIQQWSFERQYCDGVYITQHPGTTSVNTAVSYGGYPELYRGRGTKPLPPSLDRRPVRSCDRQVRRAGSLDHLAVQHFYTSRFTTSECRPSPLVRMKGSPNVSATLEV